MPGTNIGEGSSSYSEFLAQHTDRRLLQQRLIEKVRKLPALTCDQII